MSNYKDQFNITAPALSAEDPAGSVDALKNKLENLTGVTLTPERIEDLQVAGLDIHTDNIPKLLEDVLQAISFEDTMTTRDDKKNMLVNYDIDHVFELQKSRRYIEIMQMVEDALIESDEQLIIDCYKLSVDIENEIVSIHYFIRNRYALKFEELDSLVDHPTDYTRVVKKVGEELDLNTLVGNLRGLLPPAIITVFSCWQLLKTIEACDRAVALDSAKKKLLEFVESRTRCIAPNVSAYVGSGVVAAKLISTSGGLSSLAETPESGIVYLGAKTGCYMEQIGTIPPAVPSLFVRLNSWRKLGYRSRAMARMDSAGAFPSGKYGTRCQDEVLWYLEVANECQELNEDTV